MKRGAGDGEVWSYSCKITFFHHLLRAPRVNFLISYVIASVSKLSYKSHCYNHYILMAVGWSEKRDSLESKNIRSIPPMCRYKEQNVLI